MEDMLRDLNRQINDKTAAYERTLDQRSTVQAEIAKAKGDLESLGE
jgi:hypothetical protein